MSTFFIPLPWQLAWAFPGDVVFPSKKKNAAKSRWSFGAAGHIVPRYSDFVLQGRSPKNWLNSFLEHLKNQSGDQVLLFLNSLDTPRRILDIEVFLRLTRFLRAPTVLLCSGRKAFSYPANARTYISSASLDLP